MTGPLCPISIHGSPIALLKFQMAPRLILLMSCGSKKKEPRYTRLSETKALHSQRMWAEVYPQCSTCVTWFHGSHGSLCIWCYTTSWGTLVAQWLRCCATNRKVAASIPAGVSRFFIDIQSIRSHSGPGVDSASNRNECQEYFLGVKAACR